MTARTEIQKLARFKPDSALVDAVVPAANVEPRRAVKRASLLILHYTGMSSAAKAIDWLARVESRVSCHYVIDEAGAITQLVPEKLRAWHAGVSFWRGVRDINSHSIGIEIQNPGHEDGYPDFPPAQMRAVIALSRDICKRNAIARDGVLAHSDIAPERKIDPGEQFNWAALARHGLGDYIRPSPLVAHDAGLAPGTTDDRIAAAQHMLAVYGYEVPQTGELDSKTVKVLTAFQRHFRPRRVDGHLDRSTFATLSRLVAQSGRLEIA